MNNTNNNKKRFEYKYDVALSFAGEDRRVAYQLAEYLKKDGYSVFYDDYEKAVLWGKNLYEHLSKVYSQDACFCVMFISTYYSKKLWTTLERRAAQERAFNENREYILPVRLDETPIDGIPNTVGYLDLQQLSIKDVYEILVEKIGSPHFSDELVNSKLVNNKLHESSKNAKSNKILEKSLNITKSITYDKDKITTLKSILDKIPKSADSSYDQIFKQAIDIASSITYDKDKIATLEYILAKIPETANYTMYMEKNKSTES